MKRRDFVRVLGLGPLAFGASSLLGAPATPGRARTLVLLELSGGNDGLNTVVPYADPVYRKMRPTLAHDPDQVRKIAPGVGLHPALGNLARAFEAGELAIVQGLGYPDPNRSHFRSIEIWETGSEAEDYLDEGWLARAFGRLRRAEDRVADSIVMGRSEGPLAGLGMRNIVMQGRGQMLKAATRLRELEAARRKNKALLHILEVRQTVRDAALAIQARFQAAAPLKTSFPKTPLGKQLEGAARIRAAGLEVPVLKLTHGGFDHHANQKGQHQRLLAQLDEALGAFAAAMKEVGAWRDTLVVTYGEFGRRVAENASRGTDHGTAAPHFLLGGRVKGGLHGKHPSLTELDAGDLKFHVDYRDLYAAVAERWLQVSPKGLFPGHQVRPLDVLRA